jgi:hypothetical protein
MGQQSWVSVFAGIVARSRMLSPIRDREAAPMLQPG